MFEIKFSGNDINVVKGEMINFLGIQILPVNPAPVPSAPQAEVEPKKGKKGKAVVISNDGDDVPHETPVAAAQATPPPAPAKLPTEKDVQDAVVEVNNKFGIDKAIECLTKFQVKRARELREDQRAAFIELCQSVLK